MGPTFISNFILYIKSRKKKIFYFKINLNLFSHNIHNLFLLSSCSDVSISTREETAMSAILIKRKRSLVSSLRCSGSLSQQLQHGSINFRIFRAKIMFPELSCTFPASKLPSSIVGDNLIFLYLVPSPCSQQHESRLQGNGISKLVPSTFIHILTDALKVPEIFLVAPCLTIIYWKDVSVSLLFQ